jgi:hypothetical protein
VARNKKAKEYASLAAHVEPATEVTINLPGGETSSGPLQDIRVEPWIEGDLKLRQLAAKIESDYMAFVEVAKQAINESWYLKFGYPDASDYFETRIGLSYRTLRRRLTILEAIERLPAGDQEKAKRAMVEIGPHKAAAIAPMLGRDEGWEKMVEFAKQATDQAVQSAVSERLGHPRRGPGPAQPGDRFLDYCLNIVPPDTREQVEEVFMAFMKLIDSHNAVAVFLYLVKIGEAELAAHGIEVTYASTQAAPKSSAPEQDEAEDPEPTQENG